MKRNLRLLFLAAGVLLMPTITAGASVKVSGLRAQNLENPVGLDTHAPFLSWKILSDERNVRQEACRIIVASSLASLEYGNGDIWESGWLENTSPVNFPYCGRSLESGTDYFWKVKVRTNKGETDWSEPAKWTTGLMDPAEWEAVWIGLDRLSADDRREGETRLAARYLRKEFKVGKTVSKAMLHICGLGLYEAYINGGRVGTQVLAPTPTDYGKSVKYNSFDVTETVLKGDNAIGVVLGNGRYFTMREPGVRHFGFPKLLAQVVIEYTDGTKEVIGTDSSWEITAEGPIRANNEFDGEEYDARMEMPGWNRAGYAGMGWLPAEPVDPPEGKLAAQTNPNIEIMEEIPPVSIKEVGPGRYIMDMGQNMVGWVEMKTKGQRGDIVRLRFAELLGDDGELYMDNLRSARVTDQYTIKGEGEEIWEPSFVYHGFRFVEITGYPGVPAPDDFTGKVVYDKMDVTGHFETSNETVNRIYKNAFWGIRGNYRGMPTDCPQRDERMGWLGDRAVGSLGESFIFDNNLLYEKWLADIEEAQLENGALSDVSPNYWQLYNDDVTWPAAYIIIADMLHTQFGNEQPVRKHYPSMKKWMDYMLENFSEGYIITNDTYGDWCMPPESPELIHSQDPARKTEGPLLSTAFYYDLLGKMGKFARMTGRQADAERYGVTADKMKEAYNRRFFDPVTARYSNNTVTANLLSLAFGLVPEGRADEVFNNIVEKTMGDFDGHISTGLVGIQQLMRRLTDYGRGDIAFKLATNTGYPSWGYMIEKGATTIWELWNGDTADPAMNSANHVMLLGDLVPWFYQYLAGIKNTNGTGFQTIEMKPYPIEGLDWVDSSYNSVRGVVKSNWRKEGNTFHWDITIPPTSEGLVYIPCESTSSVKEGGREIAGQGEIVFLDNQEGYRAYRVASGSYSFTVTTGR